jgi:quinol monooxygenase YgiN
MFSSEPGEEQVLASFLSSLCDYIRAAPGAISVELFQHSKESGDFVIVEHWQNKESHEASVNQFPKEKMQLAIKLLAKAPVGSYYNRLL